MDRRVISSFLAILLLAVVGCVDADGTVHYFNVSNAMPRQGDTVVFHCGASLEETADDFTLHTLLVHIKKWIGGSRKWLLTVNEQIEPILLYDHYEARLLPMSEDLKEVEFKILRAQPGDSGKYICDTGKSNKSIFINVMSESSTGEHTMEPWSAILALDSMQVGRMLIGPGPSDVNKTVEEVEVKLKQTYSVSCVVNGGNTAPTVTLSSGDQTFQDVAVSGEREMVTMNRNRTEPMYAVTASMRWTPEVINIARPFVCSAGIKDPKAVWASFVPIVTNREPLFSCADEVHLKAGVNDLMVTCHIVSMHAALDNVKVNVPHKNITIDVSLNVGVRSIEKVSTKDSSFIVKVVNTESVDRAWDATLTVKNAQKMDDLVGKKFEFVAVNPFDTTAHVVSVEASGAPSGVTVSMVTILFAMVLGLCLP